MLHYNTVKRWMGCVVAILATLAGCGPNEGNDDNLGTLRHGLDVDYAAYNPNWAVSYATKYYLTAGVAPFDYYTDANCANFVSQSVLAGLIGSDNVSTVFDHRVDFQTDRGPSTKTTEYRWYYASGSSEAWASTTSLWRYARANGWWARGLHFQYVTKSTATSDVDVSQVRPGDVIFCDWENDWEALEAKGTKGFNHTVIVTGIKWEKSGQNKVRVSSHTGHYTDTGLDDLKSWTGGRAVFHIYRPTDYTRTGTP